jgi:site-specific recombinase XerD
MGSTLAATFESFLADALHLDHLRPHTLRAYRYELARAARDRRFAAALDTLSLADLEAWIARDGATPSTIGRRTATFRRFFAWAVRHEHCTRDPLRGFRSPRARQHLPRPICEPREQRAHDAAIAAAAHAHLAQDHQDQAIGLGRGDVVLEAGRETLRVREPKNGSERMVVLGPTATLRVLRGLGRGCTPAMAAGLTSNRWTTVEFLSWPYARAG